MSDLKAVFFDVNDTLWDRSACAWQVMQVILPRFLAHLPTEEPQEVLHRFNVVFMELPRKEHLRRSRPFSVRRRFQALLDSYDVSKKGLAREMTHIYDQTRRLMMRRFLREDAVKLLQELGRRGLQRGVVVNGQAARQRHRVQSLGLDRHLEHVVLADAEGYSKPDVRVFRRALELAGAAGVEALFVGDSPITDVLGASRAGLRTAWFRTGNRGLPVGFPDPDFTVTHLSEILDLL